jgi:putative ABC transport system permease protein
MALHETFRMVPLRLSANDTDRSTVPLAWRNLLADKRRLARSAAGIAFAVLLMMAQLGFRNAFIDSMLLAIRQLDGDIMLVSSAKYQFDRGAPFSRRQLYPARAVPGVASVRPLYSEQKAAVWKNPQDQHLALVQVFAFDPDQPVFLLPDIAAKLDALRQPDTVMVDRRARSNLGKADTGTETELAYRNVRVVGTFALGPSFYIDGTVIMSDRNFHKLMGGSGPTRTELPDIDVGVVKVASGFDISHVQRALRAVMPTGVQVLTKAELIDQESRFHAEVTAVGPIFGIGTLIGFVVGMMISYQVLFAELSDQRPQYATLKAMGYTNGFLVKVVLQQAVFYALVGYVPAWLLAWLLSQIFGEILLLPMGMSIGLTATSLALTLVMCVGSALIAVRRVIAADPAEVF